MSRSFVSSLRSSTYIADKSAHNLAFANFFAVSNLMNANSFYDSLRSLQGGGQGKGLDRNVRPADEQLLVLQQG